MRFFAKMDGFGSDQPSPGRHMASRSIPYLAMITQSLNIDIDAIIAGEQRLTTDDAMRLYHEASIHDLGQWSTAMANRIYGDKLRTYVIDRNINYTNVCSANCTFCAFKRNLDDDDSYTLTDPQLHEKIQELVDIGGTQILLQGGMHPDLPIEFYEDMLRHMKKKFSGVHIHGFSPPEFVEFVAIFDIDGFPTPGVGQSSTLSPEVWRDKLNAILKRLMAAGLDSIPGGGGEIFNQPVRKRIGPGKCSADQWLDVMAAGQQLGMSTSATMMFGHIEGITDRIDHMDRVRRRQDQAIGEGWPGRYVSFIAWPFQRENTPMGRLPQWDIESSDSFPGDEPDHPKNGKILRMAGATEYLRMQAISRLFFDNIQSIGASWVTMGPQIGQMALFYGATDMGSVMMEENVVSAAGTTYCLNEALICRLIRGAGFTPAKRDNTYNILKEHDGDDSPDLKVTDWATFRAKKLHIETA